MSHTEHARQRRSWGAATPEHSDGSPKRQHRPILRRTRTRTSAVRLALREERAVL